MAESISAGDKDYVIPEIDDEDLKELAGRIKPLLNDNGLLWYIADVDPHESFLYDPVKSKLAVDVMKLSEIITYHEFGSPEFFAPSVAEVVSQIPEKFVKRTIAFETLLTPSVIPAAKLQTYNPDIGRVEMYKPPYHRTLTILYSKKK